MALDEAPRLEAGEETKGGAVADRDKPGNVADAEPGALFREELEDGQGLISGGLTEGRAAGTAPKAGPGG